MGIKIAWICFQGYVFNLLGFSVDFQLKGETFTIVTKDRFFLRSSKDILLSSIGWVLVSSQFAATFRVLTPGGRGIGLRDPLLPAAVDMKGSRIPNTAEYKTKIFLPEPEKKKKIRRRSD